MKKYDVVIIGAATSGSFFARKMAEKGYSVKVIEKDAEEKVGTKYDIFHIAKKDFEKFSLPLPKEGDKEWAFEFDTGYTASPTGKYPKKTKSSVVGLHMHEYTLLMNSYAKKAGAQIEYEAEFKDFIIKNNKIRGIKYKTPTEEKEVLGKVIIDASGINAVGRTRLSKDSFVENTPISESDMFFVILNYIKFKDKNQTLTASTSWPFYKSWLAPQVDKNGGILGIGASLGYDRAESNLKSVLKNVPLEAYDTVRVEKGKTPYTRPPYSFVDDNFIVTGDAACLTKPTNGEGVTSSMVQIEIAAEILHEALKDDDTSKESLWKINFLYNKAQGADFASTRAILTKAVCASKKEFEFFFKHDIIFSESLLCEASSSPDISVTLKDALKVGAGGLQGVLTNRISLRTVKNVLEGAALGNELKEHYLNFPETLFGFEDWKEEAEKLWKQVGKMK